MNRDGKQITLDYWRQGIVFMKMLIVSARLILGVGGRGRIEGTAATQTVGPLIGHLLLPWIRSLVRLCA